MECYCAHCGAAFKRGHTRRVFCYSCLPTTGSSRASNSARAAYYVRRNHLKEYVSTGEHGRCCEVKKLCPHCGREFLPTGGRVFCNDCRPNGHPQGSLISARLSMFMRTGIHGKCCSPHYDPGCCDWCLDPYEKQRKTDRWCSRECSDAASSNRVSYGAVDSCVVKYASCAQCETVIVAWHGRLRCQACTPSDDKSFVSYKPCVTCGAWMCTGGPNSARRYCTSKCSPARRRHVPKALRLSVLNRDGWICHLCGGRIPKRKWSGKAKDPTVDHLIPMSCGGSDDMVNLAAAHHECNTRRNTYGPAQLKLVS